MEEQNNLDKEEYERQKQIQTLLNPLILLSNGWSINGGGKYEKEFIDNTLDRINEINKQA